MAFVNEYISEADVEKYGLKEIDAKAPAVTVKSRDWTIDRERDIYLRMVAYGPDELSNISTWSFYWKGQVLMFEESAIDTPRESDGKRYARSKITKLTIPANIESQHQEICDDIRDAFLKYGGGGVFSNNTNYINQIEFNEQGDIE